MIKCCQFHMKRNPDVFHSDVDIKFLSIKNFKFFQNVKNLTCTVTIFSKDFIILIHIEKG